MVASMVQNATVSVHKVREDAVWEKYKNKSDSVSGEN